MDALCEPLGRFGGQIDSLHFPVHFDEVIIDKLVHNLDRKIDPDVQDSSLTFLFECVLQIFLNIRHDDVRATEV